MVASRPTGKRRRHTPQRQVILEELTDLHTHPTAAELYALVRRRLPRISLGTVYRNLEVLCEDGLALKLPLAGSDARYDGNTRPHDHVRCTGCGSLRDVPPGGGGVPADRARRSRRLPRRGLPPGVHRPVPPLPGRRRRAGPGPRGLTIPTPDPSGPRGRP